MSFRVAFAGASGTGKSTLANFVAQELGLPINPVGSRFVAKMMGFDTPYDVDVAGKRAEFQNRLYQEKYIWETSHSYFVTDRSYMDNLSYTILHDAKSITEQNLSEYFEYQKRYTHVFYCPLDAYINLEDDKDRLHNMTYQRIYDMLLYSLLWKSGFVTQLQSGNLGERKEVILSGLGVL